MKINKKRWLCLKQLGCADFRSESMKINKKRRLRFCNQILNHYRALLGNSLYKLDIFCNSVKQLIMFTNYIQILSKIFLNKEN